MDPRLEAFKSPEFFRVFGAVASLAGAAEEELLDVSDIGPTADEAIASVVHHARSKNPDPASRLLLIKGQTGTGKTHTLLTAVRGLHRHGDVFAAVLPMVEFVSESQFDAWLTRSLVTRLSEPYLVPEGSPVPLVALGNALLDLVPGPVAKRLKQAANDGDVTVSEAEFKGLVAGIRSRMARATRIPPAGEGTIAAILGVLFGEDEAFDYLRGLPVDAMIGGVRVTNPDSEQCGRLRLEELVKIIGAFGGAVFIAFDQLEQSKLEGWEGRLTHAISRGALITETLPNVAVSFAVLPSLYAKITENIDASIRDRIERLGAQPVVLKPLSRPEVTALLERRLALLFDVCGAAPDASDPLYPFEPWFLDELAGQTSRYVTEYVQQFQRLLVELDRIPSMDDFPLPEAVLSAVPAHVAAKPGKGVAAAVTPAAPVAPQAPTLDFDAQWDKYYAQHSFFGVPNDGSKQADLMEWAIKAAMPEIEGITAMRTRRDCRGRAQTYVIGFDLEKDSTVVERREVALCNEANLGSQLADEIRSVLATCHGDARPVLVRPRGGRFPKGGRTAGPLLDHASENGAIVVRQFEAASWERIRALKDFFSLHEHLPGFIDWQRRARPLTQIASLSEVLQYPYRAPVDENAIELEAKRVVEPLKPRILRKMPTGPAVFLGNEGEGQGIFWAPFESDPKLLNFGVLVTGDSGSGKTQTLRVIIDGVIGIGAPVCIFDFKNDYADRGFTSEQGLRVHDVRRHGIPFNPLFPSAADDGMAQPIEHIFTITGVLKRVFGLGDRQAALLRDAMKTAFEAHGVDPQRWAPVDTIRAPSFDDVISILEEQKEQRNTTAISLIDRVSPLFELGLFPKAHELEVPFETMLNERLVLSLFELPTDEIKAALAELIIIRLHGYLVRGSQPRRLTRLLVLDEAWRVASSKHLENLAREGRAFGVGLAIGTQYPGDLPPDLAGSLATRIFLKNQQPDHKKAVVRAVTGSASGVQAQEVHELLEKQEMFQGLIQNQQYAPYAAFQLLPYYARERVDEDRGGTGTLG
ncbi:MULTISPECIES: ATP-binding protein [Rhodomicrobium]|uniref:ATP-binding protein n=1 Tax=Rhodomicrobium TaxID=1068 RepID=UPI000B4AC5E0|nr:MULTISPECIES: ATP-binding protein [Rhodomicrobium]